MKRYGHLYEKIYDKENIKKAILRASKGKRKRKSVQKVLRDIDRFTEEIHKMLKEKTYVPAPYKESVIREGIKQKKRIIYKPNFYPDQIIQWAIVLQIGNIIESGLYEMVCGSIKKKGSHYGKKRVEKWVRTDRKNTKHYLKLDIHHFYPSVNIEILIGKLERKFKDKDLMELIKTILSLKNELPIGILLSQWFANFYLREIDFFIKQNCKAKYYIRYMDDMIIFHANKKELHRIRKVLSEELLKLNLVFNGNWQVYKFEIEPLDFMGFRFYRYKTILRKALMYRITRQVARLKRKNEITLKNANALISRMGWVMHSDTYGMYLKWIKPFINLKEFKFIVSKGSVIYEAV